MGALGQPRYIDPTYRKRPVYQPRRYRRRVALALVYRPPKYKPDSYERRSYIPRKYHPPLGRKGTLEDTIGVNEEK